MFFDELLEQSGELSEQVDNTSNLENLDAEGNVKNDVIAVSAEIRDDIEAFGGNDVIVTGAPFDVASYLDSIQGDNAYGVLNDCGLTSMANFLTLCGDVRTEDEILEFAAQNGLCIMDPEIDPSGWGGTNDLQLTTILDAYGVEASVFYPDETGGSIEGIAKALEEGHVVSAGINAGYLWDDPNYVDTGSANHQIMLTGTVRDAETGELTGFTICDSGRGLESDSCRVVSLEEFDECYTDIYGSSVIISNEAYRATDEIIEI